MHARCLGMLSDDYDAAFADALAWDDRRPMPFERALQMLRMTRGQRRPTPTTGRPRAVGIPRQIHALWL